ncbi:MAG: hypothetical protein AAF208_14195 [Cyanobacteria bacterium P01_A01_bin.45]
MIFSKELCDRSVKPYLGDLHEKIYHCQPRYRELSEVKTFLSGYNICQKSP